MFNKRLIFAVMMVIIIGSSFGLDARAAGTVTIDWVRQFGSSIFDFAPATTVDDTGVYVIGHTSGALPGQTNAGSLDAFVIKYDHNGNELWTRQFGTSSQDLSGDIAVDASGIYVVGSVYGSLPGQTHLGSSDAFVRKYDIHGNELWTRQFGTSSQDLSGDIAVNASGIYVVGSTYGTFPGQSYSGGYTDVYVHAYDLDGNELWTHQFGSSFNDWGYGIAADSSGVYVTGSTAGTLPDQTNLGSHDAFVRKIDLNGTAVWTRQFGTSESDYGAGIASNGVGVYVTGTTSGTLPGQTSTGYSDAFVRAFDPGGNQLWTRQFGSFGSSSDDSGVDIAVDASGIYVAGAVGGSLPGQTHLGSYDAFVRKYDINGYELWTSQFGGNSSDNGRGIAVDGSDVFIAGTTSGTLPGQTALGGYDAFLARLNQGGNQAPLALPGGPYQTVEGAPVFLDGSTSSDPDGGSLSFSWSVDSAPCAFSDTSVVSPSLTCAQDGSFTVTLEVNDGQESASASASVLVDNVASTVSPITAPIDPIAVNTVIAATSAFSDAGILDAHTAVWDWGDGSSTAGSVSESGGSGSVSDSHTYTAAGVYTLALTVADQDGGNTTVTYQYVVVYDPSGGFATGAGRIQSPLGACQQLSICADVESKAHFGFVSKYQKGASVPTGNTQFRFDAGGFIFESDAYDWLVVNQAGTNAQFKGLGLVNDQLAPNGAAFRFMIWAGDGTGEGGADTFRIKIWYEDGGTEVVVYDNGTDQPVNGGQIRVHK